MTFDSMIGLGGFVLGVLSTIFAVYTYYKSKIKRMISVHSYGIQIIGSTSEIPLQELSVKFAGELVENLSKENFLFWNSGNTPIRDHDASQEFPIKISVRSDSKLLRVSLVTQSDEKNKVIVMHPGEHTPEILCSLKYLNVGQGFNIEVIYTGEPIETNFSHGFIGMTNDLIEYDKIKEMGTLRINVAINVLAALMAAWMLSAFIFFPEEILPKFPEISSEIARKSAYISLFITLFFALTAAFGPKLFKSFKTKYFGESPHSPPTSLKV